MKRRILVFNRRYLPGYRAGGPIRTIANMVDRLGDELDFRIVTLDRDSGSDGPYPAVIPGGWNQVGNAQVLYLPSEEVTLRKVREIVTAVSADFIYLNSFFDPIFTQRVLVLRRLGKIRQTRVVLAPRGEFSPGALALKSWKKNLFLRFVRATGLYGGLTWQASSELEKADILRILPFVSEGSIKIAMNLANLPQGDVTRTPGEDGGEALRICFLSRITPKKNLDFALECLARLRQKVSFAIYGPIEVPSYWAVCRRIISRLPDNVSVTYAGEIEHHRVREILSGYELFFFPTRGENYGHVIYEALSAGIPVLTSDQTPWTDLEERGAGWSLPLESPERFSAEIERFALRSAEDRRQMSRRARAYAEERANDAEALEAHRKLFCLG